MKPDDYHFFSPVPNEWQEGNIEVEITDIVFASHDDNYSSIGNKKAPNKFNP